MPNRVLPPEILAYLGPCREPESPAEIVVEQCGLGKFFGDAGLTDFDPLVAVMRLVAIEVEGLGLSLKGRKGRRVWRQALGMLQDDELTLQHNTHLPCRRCDTAFEPVIGNTLLKLFLDWDKTARTEALIALHTCPACGGTIEAKHTTKYTGDMHTPEPGSVENDDEWADLLLQYSWH